MTQLTTLNVDKETAKLVHTYCLFYDLKMTDFVKEVMEERLKGFKERLDELKKLKK